MGRPERSGPIERLKNKWEDDIKMYLKEIEWEVWTGLIWLRIWISGGLF